MSLLTLVLALILERLYLKEVELRRDFSPFHHYARSMHRLLGGFKYAEGMAGIIITLLPALLLIEFLAEVLDDALFGIPLLLFQVVLLIACLGPRDLVDEVQRILNYADSGDKSGCERLSHRFLPNWQAKYSDADQVTDATLYLALSRSFAVLFWFALLGIVGAVLYRLACELQQLASQEPDSDTQYRNSSERFCQILNWLPARLTAMAYALLGNFVAALEQWRQIDDPWDPRLGDEQPLLSSVGRAALGEQAEDTGWHGTTEAVGLYWRTLGLWVVFAGALALLLHG